MYFNFEVEGFGTLATEPEATYKINRELNLAWGLVEETGTNLFLTGRAGTGKTTFLRKLREESAKRMIVLAPTGVAAINAQGITLHSFFQLPFSPFIPGKGFVSGDKKYLNFSKQKIRLIASLTLLVIDEVSMVRPDTLDAIDMILRRLRHSSAPFGGLQLLLIGDLRQLPPVVKDEEWEYLKQYYNTPYFFESQALKKAGFQTIELTTVYRQSDLEFVSLLNAIRDGKAGVEQLEILNRRFKPGFNPEANEGYIRLTTHNRIASEFNTRKLAALPGEEFEYEAEIDGDFPEHSFPADRIIRLKPGAQVMFVKNDIGSNRRFYNGLIGMVESVSEEKITVWPITGEEAIQVERMEWENIKYVIDESTKEIVQESVGTFKQYPLRLAWAITIHKSQGLTFDKAIIDAALSFAPGQTYVALSRCRSLEGLVLGSPISPSAVITDGSVSNFVEFCENNSPDEEMLDNLKSNYKRFLIAELFNFFELREAYSDFNRLAQEYLVPLFPSLYEKLNTNLDILKNEVEDIGIRFTRSISNVDVDKELENPESNLVERIMNGCGYLLSYVEKVYNFTRNIPRGDVGNQTYAQRLERAFDNLMFRLRMKLNILDKMQLRPFSLNSYLDTKSKVLLDLEAESGSQHKFGMPSSKAKGTANKSKKTSSSYSVSSVRSKEEDKGPILSTDSNVSEKEKGEQDTKKKQSKRQKPIGYSMFETLKLFEEGKSIEEIAAERNLRPETIASHFRELLKIDRVKIENLVAAEILKEINEAIQNNPENSFSEVLYIVNSERSNLLPAYMFGLCWSYLRSRE